MFEPPYGILPDYRIRQEVKDGYIQIDPYTPENVNPASYDLTLGDEVVLYKRWVHYDEATGPRDGSGLYPAPMSVLDVRDEPEIVSFKIDRERGWVLKPGIGYLMHTQERVHTNKYVPVLDGKSSIGRLFIVVHVTAGYGDPGYDGQYTLEVTTTHMVRIFPGMKIAQMRFHTIASRLDGCEKPYSGNYTGEAARGAVPSKAFRQFKG